MKDRIYNITCEEVKREEKAMYDVRDLEKSYDSFEGVYKFGVYKERSFKIII